MNVTVGKQAPATPIRASDNETGYLPVVCAPTSWASASSRRRPAAAGCRSSNWRAPPPRSTRSSSSRPRSALAFRPERFLSSRPGTYTWLPFGGGVYRGPGAEFALFEARMLLRTLLQHRRLSAVGGRVGGRPSRKYPLPVPAGGAPVVLSARNRTDESAGKMPR